MPPSTTLRSVKTPPREVKRTTEWVFGWWTLWQIKYLRETNLFIRDSVLKNAITFSKRHYIVNELFLRSVTSNYKKVLVNSGWAPPTKFSQTDWIQSVLLAYILEISTGAPWLVRIASCRSWLLVAPIMWPRKRTKVIAANLASRRHVTAVLLSWSTWVFVVLLTMKMYEHSFSSIFLLF